MNYLKSAINFIKRNKFFAGINMLGLSMALAVSFVIILHLINELSYNSTHKNRHQIYRVVNYYKKFDSKAAHTPYPLAEDLKADFPQIEKATNTTTIRGFSVKVNNEWVKQRAIATSSDVFDIFTIPILTQNKQKDLLQSLNAIVVSKKMAAVIFPNENPIGKDITAFFDGEEKVFQVVAISEDLPKNSSLQASCFVNREWSVIPINKMFPDDDVRKNYKLDLWTTWIKIGENTDVSAINQGFDKFFKTHGINDIFFTYSLQNLSKYHLHSSDINNSGHIGNLKSLRILSVIALLILLVATFNYITLATAISTNRAKEIGIRKTNGASIRNIRNQILTESVFIALLALPIALFLMYAIIPYAENLFNHKLLFISGNTIQYILFYLLLTIGIGLISGLYSSSYLSRLNVMDVLNKKPLTGHKNNYFRSALIVFQLVIFCVFVSGTLIIKSQYQYAIDKNLGYRTSDLVFVDLDNENVDYNLFLERIKTIPEIISAAGSTNALPMRNSSRFLVNHFIEKDKQVKIEALDVDFNYMETMGLQLKEGRYFSQEFGSDFEKSIILNEEAVKQLGISNPIGKTINGRTIIGITNDFILHSIHTTPPPLAIMPTDEYIMQMAIHYQTGQLDNVLSKLKTEWQKISNNVPFQYMTSKDINREIYANEQNLFTIFSIAGLFTLLIAMLGLFGLTMFLTKRRTKEIGIRKVIGSSEKEVILLLLKGNIYKVIIAFIIATPISYLLMNKWLQGYAYNVSINFWYFILSGIIALIVVFLTVSWQSYRAASRNPVEALRYE